MNNPYRYLLSDIDSIPKEALECIIHSPKNKLFVGAICIMSMNLFKKNITQNDKEVLSKYKNHLKLLSDKKISLSKKRKTIVKGGLSMVVLITRLVLPYL